MPHVGKCSLDCIKQLLPNLAASGLWSSLAILGVPGTIPLGVGLACVAAYIGLSRICAGDSEARDKRDLQAALDIIRKRSKNHADELAAVGYQLKYNFENVHVRLTGVDSAIADLSKKLDGHFDALDTTLEKYFTANRDRLDDLCFFLQLNFDDLRPFIAALPGTVELLRADMAEATATLARIEGNQAVQATKDDLEAMKKSLLAELRGNAPTSAPSDASIDRDLVAAVERLANDAVRGGATARDVLSSDRPEDVALYLAARRAQFDEARVRLDHALDDEALKLDRELAAVAYVTGRIDEAKAALDRILRVLPDDLDAINRLGWFYKLRGNLSGAERQYNRLLELDTSDEVRAVVLSNLGGIARTRGDLDAAERFHTESLAIECKLGRLEGQAADLGNLGLIARRRGDLDVAERYHSESLTIARRLGLLEIEASNLGNLGLIAQTRGDLDSAEQFHRDGLSIVRTLGNKEKQARALGNLGLIAQDRGDLAAAEQFHGDALVIADVLGSQELRASQLCALGLVARKRGNLEGAEQRYRESLEIDRRLGRLEYQAITLNNWGNVAKLRGDVAEARRRWTESRDLFARVGVPQTVKQIQTSLDALPPES